tara:strand:- start:1392 stop:3590 length:2199 start_codon:yes stop_codon:yes gene_type:complete
MTSKNNTSNNTPDDIHSELETTEVQDVIDHLDSVHKHQSPKRVFEEPSTNDLEVTDNLHTEHLREFENDLLEESEALDEELDDLSSSKLNLKSSLLTKLELYPDGDFPVSDYSSFQEDYWAFYDSEASVDARGCTFKDTDTNLKFFKKVMLFHYIPTFHPFGTIKSFSTTLSYITGLTNIERFIFNANHMSNVVKGISTLTVRMLNESLDEAKSAEHSSMYKSLYSAIAFWSVLSENSLIPEQFRLNVNVSKVLTKERRKDVVRHTLKNSTPFKPFLQSELEELVNYALFWTDTALPIIQQAIEYTRERRIHEKTKRVYISRSQDKKFESLYSTVINDKEIIGFTSSVKLDKRDKSESIRYYSYDKLAGAIDNVRNGIFIFVALITGLRRRELAQLSFDDFHQLKNGECYVDVTRFKVSDDPNYNGEAATLPIPEYLYELIFHYHDMRNYIGKLDDEHIFMSSKSRVLRKRKDTSMLSIIVREISEATQIDGLHTHRFRKSIAEILIGQDEDNIDLVRELLGHKSFAMTLRYISRNPYLVRAVARIMEQHHVQEFENIINAINMGHFSGHALERIAAQIKKRPEEFKGARLKLTIKEYVVALLEAGEPVFLHRTPMGTYCLSVPLLGGAEATPCVEKATNTTGRVIPEPSNCQYDKCHKAGITLAAKQAIEENIIFFTGLIEQKEVSLPTNSLRELKRRLKRERQHLRNLEKYRSPLDENVMDNIDDIQGSA